MRICDEALLHGQAILSRLVLERFAPVGKQAGIRDRLQIELVVRRPAGADRIDVHPWGQPLSCEHRRRRARRGNDYVGVTNRRLRVFRSLDREGEARRRLPRELVGVLARPAGHPNARDRPHERDRLQMSARLHARADDREDTGVRAGEQARRKRRHCRGANRGDCRGVEHRAQLARLAVGQQHLSLVTVEAFRRVPGHHAEDLHAEDSLWAGTMSRHPGHRTLRARQHEHRA